MTKFKAGQKIRIIGDSFKLDPHGLEIGSVYTINKISSKLPKEKFPPMSKALLTAQARALGIELTDIPERIHVKTGDFISEFANIVYEDVELVVSPNKTVKMLEDCIGGGYETGDTFEAFEESDGEYYFFDNDGDLRPLKAHAHEVI